MTFPISIIISGGQTGADRAALDFALTYGVPHGGWCPQGRIAEDGILDDKYQLNEIENGSYRQRTKRNVMDSDGTLILNLGELQGGTMQTVRFADRHNKPYWLVQLEKTFDDHEFAEIANWLLSNEIKTLNIAGPRETKRPNIYSASYNFLTALFSYIQQPF